MRKSIIRSVVVGLAVLQAGCSTTGPDEQATGVESLTPFVSGRNANQALDRVGDRPGWWMHHVSVSPTQPTRVSTDGLFNFDEAELTPEADVLLREMLDLSRAEGRGIRLDITGHADLVGCEDGPRKLRYCLELSERRAEATKAWMVEHGIPEDAITTRGAGSLQPLTRDPAPAAQATNRRIEFRIEKAGS